MFNMFKHEDSVIFDPIWCSVIGSDISKSTGAPKKRFLEEYERDLCYRRCAKKLIDEDLIYGVTNANYAKRPDAMKITAVIYQLMYGDKEADYAKLLSLFGKEYASTADVVSGLYRRMRWIVSYEHRRADVITKILKDSNASKQNADFNYVCSLMYKSVIIGKTCAMIPKIITGNKYGKAVTNPGKNGIADNLLTLANLEQVYARNYFVPTNTLGVELLSRTVTLTRDDLNQMIEMWLSEMTNTHTCVDAREYTETYIDDDSEKTLIFPIIELEELVYQKAGREKYHIVCERGTQDGISRTMGNKVIDFKDMNNEPMPAHKYDDAGIRRDGINPLTRSGYWEEEP